MRIYVVVGNYDGLTEDLSLWNTKVKAYSHVRKILPGYIDKMKGGEAYIEVYQQELNSSNQTLILNIDDGALEKQEELEAVLKRGLNRVSWIDMEKKPMKARRRQRQDWG